jgi:hypothetical protein
MSNFSMSMRRTRPSTHSLFYRRSQTAMKWSEIDLGENRVYRFKQSNPGTLPWHFATNILSCLHTHRWRGSRRVSWKTLDLLQMNSKCSSKITSFTLKRRCKSCRKVWGTATFPVPITQTRLVSYVYFLIPEKINKLLKFRSLQRLSGAAFWASRHRSFSFGKSLPSVSSAKRSDRASQVPNQFSAFLNQMIPSLTGDEIWSLTHICKLWNISPKMYIFDPVTLETDVPPRPSLANFIKLCLSSYPGFIIAQICWVDVTYICDS